MPRNQFLIPLTPFLFLSLFLPLSFFPFLPPSCVADTHMDRILSSWFQPSQPHGHLRSESADRSCSLSLSQTNDCFKDTFFSSFISTYKVCVPLPYHVTIFNQTLLMINELHQHNTSIMHRTSDIRQWIRHQCNLPLHYKA